LKREILRRRYFGFRKTGGCTGLFAGKLRSNGICAILVGANLFARRFICFRRATPRQQVGSHSTSAAHHLVGARLAREGGVLNSAQWANVPASSLLDTLPLPLPTNLPHTPARFPMRMRSCHLRQREYPVDYSLDCSSQQMRPDVVPHAGDDGLFGG